MACIQLRRFWKSASVSLLRAEEGSSQPDLVSPEACHLLCNDGKLLDSPGALLSTISVLERRALGARRTGNTMSFLSAPRDPRCCVMPWPQCSTVSKGPHLSWSLEQYSLSCPGDGSPSPALPICSLSRRLPSAALP